MLTSATNRLLAAGAREGESGGAVSRRAFEECAGRRRRTDLQGEFHKLVCGPADLRVDDVHVRGEPVKDAAWGPRTGGVGRAE